MSRTVRAVLCCGLSLRSLLHQTSETSGIKKTCGAKRSAQSRIYLAAPTACGLTRRRQNERVRISASECGERGVLLRDGRLASAGLEHRNARENPARSHRCPTRRIHLRPALDVSWANGSLDNRGDCRESATSLRSPSSQEEKKKIENRKHPTLFRRVESTSK